MATSASPGIARPGLTVPGLLVKAGSAVTPARGTATVTDPRDGTASVS